MTWHCGSVTCRTHADVEHRCERGTWYRTCASRRVPGIPNLGSVASPDKPGIAANASAAGTRRSSIDVRRESGTAAAAAPPAPAIPARHTVARWGAELADGALGRLAHHHRDTSGSRADLLDGPGACDLLQDLDDRRCRRLSERLRPRGLGSAGLWIGSPAAVTRGNWWGLVTDTGEDDGEPIIQGPNDPFERFYVSKTPLQDRTKKRRDPRRYVDANRINYIALPYYHFHDNVDVTRRPSLGDIGAIYYRGRLAYAIYADTKGKGSKHIGEGSMALARALGINPRPISGGTNDRNVLHVIYPGSGNGKPRTQGEIDNIGCANLTVGAA